MPHVLAIVAGTTVDFPNNDRTYHNVFSLSKTRSFDLGRYAAGHSKAVRFDRPGIVRVFCDIHSHMSAFILVFAHRYFAVTDDDGRYRIDNVPPGTYTVVAWNEAMALESRRVGVPEAAATSSSRSSSRSDEDLLVADQPDLPRQRALAVLAIAVAVYRFNVAVTAQAENELRRGLEEAGTLLEEYRDTLFDHFTREARLIADLSNLKAAMDTRDPPTVQPIAERISAAASAPTCSSSPTRRDGCSPRQAACACRMSRQRTTQWSVRPKGTRSSRLWPHPGGIIQVVSVPSLIVNRSNEIEVVGTLSVGFSLDEQIGAAVQGADQQRDRVRRRRARSRRRRFRRTAFGTLAAWSADSRRPPRARLATPTTSRSAGRWL